jgi:lipopolysaccharide/colanic/teichoic acid biosynthesis glycosyltransferase
MHTTYRSEPELILAERDASLLYHAAKRCFDIVCASLLLVALAPLFLLIALLIKRDSSGPAVFCQERVSARRRTVGGKSGWELYTFRIYKFRTMFHNADDSLHQAYIRSFIAGDPRPSSSKERSFKLTDDPRITPIGHFLRRTSLDELPQLLNVLKGEMSLVGPRPVPVYEVREYQPQHYQRLTALPGITGLWQVKGRSQVSFEEMVEMDCAYICNQSLWLDCSILLLTVSAVLGRRGAH